MTTTSPAQTPDTPNSKIFSPLDHYNSAAAALHQIADHHDDADFGVQDAEILLQLALTHAALGQLKLGIDKVRQDSTSTP